jgi:hypothetical protein
MGGIAGAGPLATATSSRGSSLSMTAMKPTAIIATIMKKLPASWRKLSLFGCKRGHTHKVVHDNPKKLRARAQLPQLKPGSPHKFPVQRAPRAAAPPRKRENPMNRHKKFAITPTKSIPLATTHAIKITTKEQCQNQLIE